METQKTPAPRGGLPAWVFALGGMIGLMVAANIAMVLLSSRGRHDLVRTDYYQAGLDQDGLMARAALGRSWAASGGMLATRDGWRVEADAGGGRATECAAHFYRPDHVQEDFTQDLAAASGTRSGRPVWMGAPVQLRRGHWLVRLVWSENGRPIMETSFSHNAPG